VGDVIRGFGFTHDGVRDTLSNFHRSFDSVFPPGPVGQQERDDIGRLLLAYDSNLHPIVGQQTTVTGAPPNLGSVWLLGNRTLAGECDLVGKGVWGGVSRGMIMVDDKLLFKPDRADEPPLSLSEVATIAAGKGQAITFTCVPPGSGIRMGLDRDEDGFDDRDELDAGSDPSNPTSVPQPPGC